MSSDELHTLSVSDTNVSLVPVSTPARTLENKLETHILAFKSIHSFITSLNEQFGEKNKPLKLYARLIEQTTFSHEIPIQKHVQAFTTFCIANRSSIYDKKYEDFLPCKVIYSERVFIDLKELFELADKDQKNVMWQHVLTISALVDSTGRAREILRKSKNGKNEKNFLTDIIEKVEKNIKLDNNPNSNPFEMVGQLMGSGLFTDIIGSMNSQVSNGELDMSKMIGVVQNMVSTLSQDQPEVGKMMGGLMKSIETGDMTEFSNIPGFSEMMKTFSNLTPTSSPTEKSDTSDNSTPDIKE